MAISNGEAGSSVRTKLNAHMGEYLHGSDYGLINDDVNVQTAELEAAIAAASSAQKTLILPPGSIRYAGPLAIPPNTHIIGTGGTSFCTALKAIDTAGVHFDGDPDEVYHSSLSDVILYQLGDAAAFVLKIENTYSSRIKNVRIFEPEAICTDALVVVENSNNDVLFDNLIFQLTTGTPQQTCGVRLKNGCGTIRFIKPDIEGCENNMIWEGGQIEVYSPYMETAGVASIELNPNVADTTAYFRCFGGELNCAASAHNFKIMDNVHDVDVYGTNISGSTSEDVYLYDPGSCARINFWGVKMDYSKLKGAAGWMGSINTHGRRLLGSKTHNWGDLAPLTSETTTVTVTGAKLGYHTARANMSISTGELIMHAWVSADDTVSVTAFNPHASGGANINLASATLYAFADPAPIL